MDGVQAWNNSRKIEGFPHMTFAMFQALHALNHRDDVGYLWLLPDGIHKHTINALIRNHWVFESRGLDGVKYQILPEGLRALRVYSRPPKRIDGICPNCNERPVNYSSSGRRDGYCVECLRELSKRKRQRPHGCRKPGQLCPMCGERERHVSPSGKIRTYCTECRRIRAVDDRKKKHQDKLERIASGEIILCCQCGEGPVHYGDTWVSDYCPNCSKAYMDAYNRKRRGGK